MALRQATGFVGSLTRLTGTDRAVPDFSTLNRRQRALKVNIPPRKNVKPWKPDTAGAIARNGLLPTSKRLGRTIWRRWSGHHRRSHAEMWGGSKTVQWNVFPMIGCTASRCPVSTCPPGTSTVRVRSSNCVLPF
jgi:hypothetical protein